mgnify:CR=1 FL=1
MEAPKNVRANGQPNKPAENAEPAAAEQAAEQAAQEADPAHHLSGDTSDTPIRLQEP